MSDNYLDKYRAFLRFNKNTVQRIFQLKGWQVRRRSVGFRPRVEVSPSKAASLNERWATDLCRVWTSRDGWASLALVIDCHNRELIGWHLSRNGRAQMASSALEQALINRFGTLGRVTRQSCLTQAIHSPIYSGRFTECTPDAFQENIEQRDI